MASGGVIPAVMLLLLGVAVGVVVAAGGGLVAGVAGAEVLRVPRRPRGLGVVVVRDTTGIFGEQRGFLASDEAWILVSLSSC